METAPAAVPESSPSAPLLCLSGVEKRYGDFRPVLLGLHLSVSRGEFLVVEGPGGAGKSVLLRLLAGLESASAGSVEVAGEDLARMRSGARLHLRRSMGILPPGDGLLDQRSALENVALAAWVAGSGRDEGMRRARAALELLGLDAERHGAAACAQLAGGERHCVALARALVNRPALLLLDDLAATLDPAGAARVLQALDRFSEAGVTVVATTRGESTLASVLPPRARRVRLQDGSMAQ